MARKVTVTLYQFNELSARAKEKARDWFREASSGDEWWENVYEDAKQIGLSITKFDLQVDKIKGKFTMPAERAAHVITMEHGKDTDTHKLATDFLNTRFAFPQDSEQDEANEEKAQQFLLDILGCYLSMLKSELDDINSDYYIDETIRANEYEFYSDGRRARDH